MRGTAGAAPTAEAAAPLCSQPEQFGVGLVTQACTVALQTGCKDITATAPAAVSAGVLHRFECGTIPPLPVACTKNAECFNITIVATESNVLVQAGCCNAAINLQPQTQPPALGVDVPGSGAEPASSPAAVPDQPAVGGSQQGPAEGGESWGQQGVPLRWRLPAGAAAVRKGGVRRAAQRPGWGVAKRIAVGRRLAAFHYWRVRRSLKLSRAVQRATRMVSQCSTRLAQLQRQLRG